MKTQPGDKELKISLVEVAVNELAFLSLNPVALDPSDDMPEAIDRLREMIRVSALGITVGLLEIAKAIEASK